MSEKNNRNTAAKVLEEAQRLGHDQRVQGTAMDVLRQQIGMGTYLKLSERERGELLDKVASHAGDLVKNRILVEDIRRETLANVTDTRWLANAALTGIIGGTAFAGAAAVVRGVGRFLDRPSRPAQTFSGVDGYTSTVPHAAPNPFDDNAPTHRATPRPGSVSRLKQHVEPNTTPAV